MTDTFSRAQSETIGFVLIFALVIAGAGLTVAIGGSGILDTQSSIEYQRAENSMTLFDSRAAMVALGDSGGQTVSLGQGGGAVSVHEGDGWMRVTHHNYTAEKPPQTEVIFNETLGKVVYESGSGVIAYQGGGVWQVEGDGDARMVSPPEFHYRGATLTLPAIRVHGEGSASGSVDMNVRPLQQARLVYPNRTTVEDDGVGAPYDETVSTDYRNYTNPIRNGTVNVTVKSEYADGWEAYFRQRTTGEVTRDGEKVTLTLSTISGPPGEFELPTFGTEDFVEASGIGEDHPLDQFDTSLVYGKGGGTNEFSYWHENESGAQWELHVSPDVSGNFKCGDTPDVYVAQYYYNGSSHEEYELWETTIPASSSAITWGCNDGDPQLTLDFTSTDSATEMAYSDSGVSTGGGGGGSVCDGNQWCFGSNINDWSMKNEVEFDEHGTIGSCEPGTYTQGDTSTGCMLGDIVDHYLSEAGPNVDLHAKTGPGGSTPIQQDPSQGTLLYQESTAGRFVTFLHITENEIEVSLDT